jgi:hypothetical protein
VVTFEGGLPVGVGTIGAWPELTDLRRDELQKVRRLAAMVQQPMWPRHSCLSCGGHGVYLIDAEIDLDFQALQALSDHRDAAAGQCNRGWPRHWVRDGAG